MHKVTGQTFCGKYIALDKVRHVWCARAVQFDVAAECVCALCSQHTLQALLMQISEDVEREILNHRLLDHENIVRFHEVCSAPSHSRGDM